MTILLLAGWQQAYCGEDHRRALPEPGPQRQREPGEGDQHHEAVEGLRQRGADLLCWGEPVRNVRQPQYCFIARG